MIDDNTVFRRVLGCFRSMRDHGYDHRRAISAAVIEYVTNRPQDSVEDGLKTVALLIALSTV